MPRGTVVPMKDDPDFRKHNESALLSAAKDLETIVLRVEELAREREDLSRDISEVYVVAKSKGYDAKVLRRVVSERRAARKRSEEERALLEQYLGLLEML